MKSYLIFSVFLIGLSAAACDGGDGKGGPDATETPDAEVVTSELDNTEWHASCFDANLIKLSFGETAADSTITFELYGANDCSGDMQASTETGFTRSADDSQAPRWLDAVIDSHTMTMWTDQAVTFANNQSFGGFDDWQKAVPRDVLGIDLGNDILRVNDGDQWLGIYKIDSNWISWEVDIHGMTRPTTFTNDPLKAEKQ